MKIAALIARILLGLMFFVFGLNGFLHFIPIDKASMPTGLAGQYVGALMDSHYFYVVAGLQTLGGLLLLVGFYVPLALTLLGPVIVNILCYHIFLDHKGLLMAIVVTVLWSIVALRYRENFAGLFAQKA